jgi:hypothetical protein
VVGGRRQHFEAKPLQSKREPLAAFDHAHPALLKIGFVLQGGDGAGLGEPAKRIGVEAVLHPGERLDQGGVADRIADPQPGQRPGFGHGLNDQKVGVGRNQRYRGLGAEIDIGLVDHHGSVRVLLQQGGDLGS